MHGRLKSAVVFVSFTCVLVTLAVAAEPPKDHAASIIEFTFEMGPRALRKGLFQMAVWVADEKGKFLDTVYVTSTLGKRGLGNGFSTILGKTVREHPETAPVWAHARGILDGKSYFPSKAKPLPDAVSGATPKAKTFVKQLSMKTVPKVVKCYVEVKVSGSASIVFAGDLDTTKPGPVELKYVGTGDPKGKSGKIRLGTKTKIPPKDCISSVKAALTRVKE